MNVKKILDKELILAFICSALCILYKKIIEIVILYIDDRFLELFIKPKIKINIEDELLDLSDDSLSDDSLSDSSLQDIKYIKTLDNYNNYLQLWEYDTLLLLFNLRNYSLNIQKSKNLPILYDTNIKYEIKGNKNELIILDSFLFNIKFTKPNDTQKIIKFGSINQIKYKLNLYYKLSGNNNFLNSNVFKKLNKDYKYLFAIYKVNTTIKYVLIDIKNNYNLITHKKILFNKIKLIN